MSSNFLFVFFSISLREFLISSLWGLNFLLKLFLGHFLLLHVYLVVQVLVVGSLDFTGVLFFVVLSVLLHYLTFPLICIFGAVCNSGDQSSRSQWIQRSHGCPLWCSQCHSSSHPVGHSVFLKIAQCFWGLLCSHRVCGLRPAEG